MHRGKFSFLITGAGRGGTSLLAGLLGFHPELEVGFEAHNDHLQGLKPESAATVATRLAAFRTACEKTAAASAKIWGNKITTEQFGILTGREIDEAAIAPFFDSLADLKHVFILRDGRTCVRSKVARTGQSIETACARWLYSTTVFHYFEAGKVNGIAVKFEDLLLKPETELRKICDFLGIAYRAEMLQGTSHPDMLKDYQRTGFDLDAIKPAAMEEKPFQTIAHELRACGYLT